MGRRTAAAFMLTAAILTASCGSRLPAGSGASGSPIPTPTPEVTHPPFSQPPIDPPTYAKWGVDNMSTPGKHTFELYHDNNASEFRIVDAGGRLVLRLPIAGSGIFPPGTCMNDVRPQDKNSNATWTGIDDATLQDLTANSSRYRVEVDTIGHGTITLPLVDTGCRR